MKPIIHKFFLLILATLVLAVVSTPLTAQVYKTVDKDGNVTYTDQPPSDGSKPIKLRPISVIEAPKYEVAPKADEESAADGEPKQMTLKYLRKNYRDFAIIAPQSEETIWNPEQGISVAWNVGYQLQAGMKVVVSVDGKQMAVSSDQVIPVAITDRGEHTVTAELQDAKNRRIATAEPVVFYIRQPGFSGNRIQVIPHRGG